MRRLLCIALLPLAGCAGLNRSPQDIQAADPTTPCLSRLRSDPFIAGQLGSRMVMGDEPSMAQMADRTKPTGDQLAAIISYANTRNSCVALGDSYRRANLPGQVFGVMDAISQTTSVNLAKLHSGELTFGEYNTRSMDARINGRNQLLQFDQSVAQNEANRRAVVIQQQPYQLPVYQMPIQRQTYCNTQRIGNQYQTVCQ